MILKKEKYERERKKVVEKIHPPLTAVREQLKEWVDWIVVR